MYKIKKNLFFGLLLFFIFFSVVCLYLPTDNTFAALEVDYPVLRTGSSITTETKVPEYLKYVFDFSMFVGFLAVFLSLVASGVFYLLSPALPGALNTAKDRIWGSISGLLILVTLYLIITTINPALSFFKTTTLSRAPEFPPLPPQPGVLFYKNPDCPSPDPNLNTGSISDLKDLNKNIKSARIIQGGAQDVYFVSILYENPKFRGKCFYVNPNIGCNSPNNNIEPFASSASIHRYRHTFESLGNVTFFRNADSNPEGGYLTITDSDVGEKGLYIGSFDQLRHTGSLSGECTVPQREQDCATWSDAPCPNCVIIDGKYCSKTQCPSLAGDNIGSIKIDGNYVALFIYYDPIKDRPEGPWSFCQAFPTPDDINETGPQQIRWEDIKNNNLYKIPNWFLIIPIEK